MNSCSSSGVPRITETYARATPDSSRRPDSRMSATQQREGQPEHEAQGGERQGAEQQALEQRAEAAADELPVDGAHGVTRR